MNGEKMCILFPKIFRLRNSFRFKMFDLCVQTLKYSSKSHLGGDHRHEKMRDSSDVTPPCKILRRSDSPENKLIESSGHSRAKAVHTHRTRERDGGKAL